MKGRGGICIICSDTKRRPKIDRALQQGSSCAHVSRVFQIDDECVRRHARRHLGIPGRNGVSLASKPTPAAAAIDHVVVPVPSGVDVRVTSEPAPAIAVKPMSLRSPEDVLSALEWSVAETKELLQRAKDAGDLRLQNQLLQTAIGALDKLAKSTGLYNDGTVVNVNPVDQKIVALFSQMSVGDLSELREQLRNEKQRTEMPN